MKKIAITLASMCVVCLLAGCATSDKVLAVQAGDNRLTCDKITVELEKLDQAEKEVESKKGATGTNVAAALLWLPGLAYTYYDAGQAKDAINSRRSNLIKIYNDKNCQ